jgi:hypothetical protein
MSKEAILMAIDAGSAMDEMYDEYSSRLKIALDCVSITIQQKIFQNSSHEVGFAIFGDADAAVEVDDNYLLLKPIGKPDL